MSNLHKNYIKTHCVKFICLELEYRDILDYWQPDTVFYAGKGSSHRLAGPPLLEASATGPDRLALLRAASDTWMPRDVRQGPECFFYATFEEQPLKTTLFECSHLSLPVWQIQQNAKKTSLWISSLSAPVDPQPVLKRFKPRAHAPTQPLFAPSLQCPKDPAFEAAVMKARQQLGPGDKVVLSRQWELPGPQQLSLPSILSQLRAAHPRSTPFAQIHPQGEVFFGATPETLMRTDAQEASMYIYTEALGGSAPPGSEAREKLLKDPKERLEHDLVVQDLTRKLQNVGLNPQAHPVPQVLDLKHIQHLHTPIQATCPSGTHLLDLAQACFPTPAVCGYPEPHARALIAALEPRPRGLYTGLWGWYNAQGHGQACVALRCATWTPGSVRLYAGAGILRSSSPSQEKAETDRKFQAMCRGASGGWE